jgi:hypothetical protein
MARCKPIDRTPRLLPVVLSEQIQPGTFEFALDHLVDHELDLSALDARFSNDETGASAYDPRVMLKIVLLAYSRGLISSRRIEAACLHNVQFIAISGDSQPSDPLYEKKPTGEPQKIRLYRPEDFQVAEDESHCTCPAGRKLYSNGSGCTINGRSCHKYTGSRSSCGPCEQRQHREAGRV